ncbi:hypothetical protein SDRG_15346 [Saprolegnia diclina VS20]|uniref:Uncharacterized protein n=1 Tax=Saprolegnia diclina (strain VS20) TaxID=1156394 RepID=T0Q0E3_SAPDV|nr:hypothetical protein SDRG_15346 [Saprolegnia diclina VS20]EQC26835.1 hypothetical protein SDRG_15346 [Saprolegnia diclina VS20]|eukprot:XP_008619737.1 hypothetical protein SDRG_15346 [Saprolegnia diclina VS20]
MSRPSATQSQNLNNFIGDRSSTRLAKPPGGGSTVGSLIFGGADAANSTSGSFMDDRKGRRGSSNRPEQIGSQVFGNNEALVRHGSNNSGGGNSDKEAQKYQLQQQQYMQQQMERRGSNQNQSASDIFLQNAPGNIAGERRTRRMYNGGQSSGFQLS